MVTKETSARRANEVRKVFKVQPDWKDPKDLKVSKALAVKPDHQAQPERKESWVYLVSQATLDHPERRETKAHPDGLEHLATKEIE